MAPFPTKVSQVRIYPYIPNSLIVVPAVFSGGAGTYSVGTLGRNVFYNLDLTSGEPQHGGAWSVAVAGGERPNPLQEGMTFTIAGTNVATGKPFHICCGNCKRNGRLSAGRL